MAPKLKLTLSIVLNVISSVGLIMLNKVIFDEYEWQFATSLTAGHFLCNWLACEFLIRWFQMNRMWLPLRESLPMAIGWSGSIILANLSLLRNSTGFYQASKLLSAPVVIAWQWAFFGISTDWREMVSLLPLVCGIGLVTVTDTDMNLIGACFAFGQLLSAAAVQTWVKTKQVDYNINSTQLLNINSIICLIITTPAAPFIDQELVHAWVWDTWIPKSLGFLLLASGILALGMNIACFLIIGYSDPLTFQVVGYLKTVLVFILGAYVFQEGWNAKKLIGIGITVVGLIIYRTVKLHVISDTHASIYRKWSTRRNTTIGDLHEAVNNGTAETAYLLSGELKKGDYGREETAYFKPPTPNRGGVTV